jgi:hypothetical protein
VLPDVQPLHVQLPLEQVRPFEVQSTQSTPASPQVLFAVPSEAQLEPLMHWVQQLPLVHFPPLHEVFSALLTVPQPPLTQVGSWHSGAPQLWHEFPVMPQAPVWFPGWQEVPLRQPVQQLPDQHLPPVQLVRFGLLVVPQLPPLHVGSWHCGALQALQL